MADTKQAKPQPKAQQYRVTQAREINGAFCPVGHVLTLMPAQAKYYLPPLGAGLEPHAPQPPAKEPAPSKD